MPFAVPVDGGEAKTCLSVTVAWLMILDPFLELNTLASKSKYSICYRDQCSHKVDLSVLEYWNHGTMRMMLRWIHVTEMAVGNMKHDTKYKLLLNKSG